MNNPIVGTTYRHWKGDLYRAIGFILIKNNFREGMAIKTEFGYAICSTPLAPGDEAFVYQSEDGEKFVRTRESFAEVLGDKDEGTMYYQFQRIMEEAIAP
jgi:hypothetical protein